MCQILRAAGAFALYSALVLAPGVQQAAEISFHEASGQVEIRIDGKPFSNFYHGSQWPQPFLHPLRTVSGISVTRGYPVEEIEGESRDHPWHRGLWYTHGDINGVDFWRDLGPEKTGRLVLRGAVKTEADRLSADFDLIAPDKKRVGRITQEFRFARRDERNIVDVRATIHADAGPIRMGDTEEGSLGIRFADEFREDRGAILMNSDRLTGTDRIWGKRAKWVDYSTKLKGETAGVLILDHPSNPKYPTFWHSRGYGLNAANPFGEHDFFGDSTRDGGITIPAAGSLTFRYRVVIHPGPADAAASDRLAQEFGAE